MKLSTTFFALFMMIALHAKVYQLSEVEVAPVFAKGKMTQNDFVKYYLQYPISERGANVQGNVLIEYVVDSTGMLTDPVVKKNVNPALDKEALRVVELMPFFAPAKINGSPVAVKMQIEIPFVIIDSDSELSNISALEEKKTKKNPLYVVDSKILQSDANIDPESIKEIRIIKGEKAIELYGERARDGIIMIETK